MKRDAHTQSLPFITTRALGKGAPPLPFQVLLTQLSQRNMPIFQIPLSTTSELPVNELPCYLTGSLWRKVPVSRAFTRPR